MEAPGVRRCLEDVVKGMEALFDETEKPPAVPPPTPGAAVQTSDTSACSDRKGSLSVRVSMRSRGVLLRAEPLQVQTPRCAPWLLGSLPLDCGKLMLVSLRQWDVASTSVASKAVFLLCSRGGRLIVPHLQVQHKSAAEVLASGKFLVEDVESLALPAALSMGVLARDRVLQMRNLRQLSVRGLRSGSTSAAVIASCLPCLPRLTQIELQFKISTRWKSGDASGREGAVLLAVAKVSTLRCLVLDTPHACFSFHGDLVTALKYLAPRLETLALIGGVTLTSRGCRSLVQDVIDMLGEGSMQLSSLRTLQLGEAAPPSYHQYGGIPMSFRSLAGVLRACPRLQVLLLGRETPYQSASRRGLCFEPGILGHNILVDNFERSLLGPVSAGHAPYLREVRLVQPRPAAAAAVRGIQDLRESFAHKGIALDVVPFGVRLARGWRSRSRAGYARADACVAASRAPASAPGES